MKVQSCLAGICLTISACSSLSEDQQRSDLTSLSGVERGIHFDGEVLVAPSATDAEIDAAILKQTTAAIGAFREDGVALASRHTEGGVSRSSWIRTPLHVVDPWSNAVLRDVLRVRYRYEDRAAVSKRHNSKSAIAVTLLAADYESKFKRFGTQCSEDGSLIWYWYHFMPQKAGCRTIIANEAKALADERKALGQRSDAIGPVEADRVFVPAVAQLDPPGAPTHDYYPEYDRLLANKDQIIVYAFLGIDKDSADPDDSLVQEGFQFYRELLKGMPNLRPVHTEPFALLQDVYVDGVRIQNVTYDRMFKWIIDRSDYPAEVRRDESKIRQLRRATVAAFVERWIYWDVPLEVTMNDATRKVTLEIRSFFGREEGDHDVRMHAKWRFLEAFWYGDVFLYNGHSHLGYSELSTEEYTSGNFNDRYQIMMIQSCISFNYYRGGYVSLKPGGTQNLDTISNGLSSYLEGSGQATARFVTSLFDGKFNSYRKVLENMRVNVGWTFDYEPLRIADGELDNTYDPSKRPMSLRTLPAIY